MMKQVKFGCRGVVYLMVSFILVFILVAGGLGGKKKTTEASLCNLINLSNSNQEMVKLVWMNCRLELFLAKEGFKELDLFVPEEPGRRDIYSNSRSSKKLEVEEVLNVCHPQIQQTLLDCLGKNNFMFLTSGEDPAQRGYRRELSESFGLAPAPSPALVSPSPSPLGPDPEVKSPATPLPFFPVLNNSDVQPNESPPASLSPDLIENKEKSKHKTVVIAVVVTAVATFCLAALLFCCYIKFCRSNSGRRNDERPLLSLSLSDYSIGKPSNQSFPDSSNHNLKGESYYNLNAPSDSTGKTPPKAANGLAVLSSEEMAQRPHTMSGSHGLPPLKPPPGRTGPPPTLPVALHPLPPLPRRPSHRDPHGRHSGPLPPPSIPIDAHAPPAPTPPRGPPAPPPPRGGPSAPPPPRGGPSAPPPPRGGPPAPPPPRGAPHASHAVPGPSTSASAEDEGADAPRTKLKPFFWDKVLANPDHSMVWHQIKSGSFQFNEEMIENLFGYAAADNNNGKKNSNKDQANEYIQIIDQKKAQNLAILLKALNVTTEEVCDALQEGNELPAELIETLLKMAPTADEEKKLRLYNGEVSRLGNAERFLKVLVDVPFAFKRLEALLFMCTFQEDELVVKESFATLEAACTELRNSRLFLKLLEAVLKTGNRMNDGTFRGGAQAFKLDTLLKLSDVKGADGKTTLLHFVVQEIIRSEGIKALRANRGESISSVKSDDLVDDSSMESEEEYCSIGLQAVSALVNDLQNVKKAAIVDSEGLTGTVAKFSHRFRKAKDFLNSEMKNVAEENGFHQALKSFLEAEAGIMKLVEEEKRIMGLVKSTGDYFHGNTGKDEGLRIFIIVRDFLFLLDKVCKEVRNNPRKSFRSPKGEDSTLVPRQPPPR